MFKAVTMFSIFDVALPIRPPTSQSARRSEALHISFRFYSALSSHPSKSAAALRLWMTKQQPLPCYAVIPAQQTDYAETIIQAS